MKTIIINSKKYGVHHLLVDDEDFDRVSKFKWSLSKWKGKTYAIMNISKSEGGGTIKIHRLLLGHKYKTIDHIDGNGLNNQKNNLRGCTTAQNTQNRVKSSRNKSGYKGVWFITNRAGTKRFTSQIKVSNKSVFVGYFYTAKEAAIAYNEAAIKYHGEFAKLNEI